MTVARGVGYREKYFSANPALELVVQQRLRLLHFILFEEYVDIVRRRKVIPHLDRGQNLSASRKGCRGGVKMREL